MERVFAILVIGGTLIGPSHAAGAQSTPATLSSSIGSNSRASLMPDLPPLPRGKSTVLGGAIRAVDPVRDQLVLDVYGEKPMKILYDERTQIFRDGKKISLRELAPAAHASVQTTLDGPKIFAVSVHVLSQQGNGDYQGRVLSYSPGTGVLLLNSEASREPFRVTVSNQTAFQRAGQSAFSSVQSGTADLVPGSLVQIQFAADNRGRGVAQQVTVLAAPGATFIFRGDLSTLDMHTGALVLLDTRTSQSYQIFFDPGREPASKLRPGQHVRISADYDGRRYVATDVAIE